MVTDYISREAAIDVMCEILCDGRENCDENTYCCSAKLMKSIPAADVRPVVKAVWEDAPNPQWPAYDIRHCSCCGWNIPKSKLRAKDLSWRFCPNCGADMREES